MARRNDFPAANGPGHRRSQGVGSRATNQPINARFDEDPQVRQVVGIIAEADRWLAAEQARVARQQWAKEIGWGRGSDPGE